MASLLLCRANAHVGTSKRICRRRCGLRPHFDMKAPRLTTPLALLPGLKSVAARVGYSSQPQRSLIIGGSPTSHLEFPYFVQSKSVRSPFCRMPTQLRLQTFASSQASREDASLLISQLTCGGTLVAKDVVLSAAHCAGRQLTGQCGRNGCKQCNSTDRHDSPFGSFR